MSERSSARRLRALAEWALTAATIALIGWLLWSRRAELARALSLDAGTLAAISAGVLVMFLANGFSMRALAKRFDADVPYREAVGLGLMVSALNYLPLKGGTIANGLVLRQRYGIPLARFAALVAANNVVHLWVTTSLSGAVMLLGGVRPELAPWLIVLPTAGVAGLAWWASMRRTVAEPPSGFLRTLVDGMRTLFADPKLLALLVGVQLVILAGSVTQMYFSFRAVSEPLSVSRATAVTALALITGRLSVLPGGLGFREGGAAVAAVAVGVPAEVGLAAAVIDRAVTMVWVLGLGAPATVYFSRLTGRSLFRTAERGESPEPDRAA